GDRVSAPGYAGEMVGTSDLPRLNKTLSEALDHAYERAIANARAKERTRSRSAVLGDVLGDVTLAPVDVRQDTIDARYEIDPRELPLDEAVKYVREVSERVKGIDSGVAFNYISAYTQLERQLFVSTEGANIDQTTAVTQGTCFVVAQGPDGHQELYDFTGHPRGWELITNGLKENQLGHRIGSDLVTTFSDPTIEGFGHYIYDDEGTPARRIYHFDKGIFNGFSNSRQTAAIVGAEPNGHYKATDASLVPLIR